MKGLELKETPPVRGESITRNLKEGKGDKNIRLKKKSLKQNTNIRLKKFTTLYPFVFIV